MTEPLNGEPGIDFSKEADAFEAMARGIKAKQRGLAGAPVSHKPPPAPEQVWMTRFGYRAIGPDTAAASGLKMALEAHAPVSFRPAPMPDLAGLKPVLPQMETARPPATPTVAEPAPAVPPAFGRPGDLRIPKPEEPKPRRGFFARMFGG